MRTDVIRVQGLAVVFGRPQLAGRFVGQGDRGLVVPQPLRQGQRPVLCAIKLDALVAGELDAAQAGACAVDQQHAQVDIAAFGDPAELSSCAAGVFARCQGQGAGEVSSGREAIEVADRGAHRGSGVACMADSFRDPVS